MKWFWRSLALLILVAGGIWLWLTLHPSPQKVIRRQLHQLAQQASFDRQESDLIRLAKVGGITRFFASEVEVKLAFREQSRQGTITHEMFQMGAAELRLTYPGGLKIEFLDINVTLAPGQVQATAEFTMKATFPADNTFNVQEMKAALRRVNDQWIIYRVETVRTLQ